MVFEAHNAVLMTLFKSSNEAGFKIVIYSIKGENSNKDASAVSL